MSYNYQYLGKLFLSHDWRSHDTITMPFVSTRAVCLDNNPPLAEGIVIRSREMVARVKYLSWSDVMQMVDRSGNCWIWGGVRNRDGYGQLTFAGKRWAAHRLFYSVERGDIPEGLYVCHHCDNPSCVNPQHLFLGTALDNNRDRDRKGRGVVILENLTSHRRRKLSDEAVRNIRRDYATGLFSYTDLAARFGVTPQNIGYIITRRHFKHIA